MLALGVCAVIPLFLYAAEIAAAKTLLIFRKPGAMDIFTLRPPVHRASRNRGDLTRAAAVECRADREAIVVHLLRNRLPHAARADHVDLFKRHR